MKEFWFSIKIITIKIIYIKINKTQRNLVNRIERFSTKFLCPLNIFYLFYVGGNITSIYLEMLEMLEMLNIELHNWIIINYLQTFNKTIIKGKDEWMDWRLRLTTEGPLFQLAKVLHPPQNHKGGRGWRGRLRERGGITPLA